ncbi:hypothetical protein EVAR_57705_1 [Eumeta japonica]|uniref:Uncharacterized protein n=1 Tax=Eumeta variegata TaxID=151549 RepID=A0A4C1Y516_EUMVA|nr:hypothetical protein EVAR_57705_1 [Eumeta japonica]
MAPSRRNVQVAAAAFIILHTLVNKKKKRRSLPRWWVKKLYQERLEYGNRLLHDIGFEEDVTNFVRMSTVDFEHLLQSIETKVKKNDTYMRPAITVKERLAIT